MRVSKAKLKSILDSWNYTAMHDDELETTLEELRQVYNSGFKAGMRFGLNATCECTPELVCPAHGWIESKNEVLFS